MRKHLLLASLLALLPGRAATAKTQLLTTDGGSPVHWEQTEITVSIDPGHPSRKVPAPAAVASLERAAAAWNRVPAGQPKLRFVSAGPAHVAVRFCRTRWNGDAVDLGSSQFNASSTDGKVSRALVLVNECDHTFTAAEHGVSRFDLQSVLTHELGHVLGLGHGEDPSSIMYPNGGGTSVRKPNLDDKTALALLYFGRFAPAGTLSAGTGHTAR